MTIWKGRPPHAAHREEALGILAGRFDVVDAAGSGDDDEAIIFTTKRLPDGLTRLGDRTLTAASPSGCCSIRMAGGINGRRPSMRMSSVTWNMGRGW